jgi:YHS domain-containing protein
MNAFVFQKHMCKTCDKKIEITQHSFMGMNHHFCSYLCRRNFLMNAFVFQKHMCKTCDYKIEITQHSFMGMNHHFCSYLCRRNFLMKQKLI